ELRRILLSYGEEKFAGRIAAAIVARRDTDPVVRTGQLAELVRDAIPAPARRRGGNPAKRTFQALRIAVNAELEVLARAVPAAIASVSVAGRLVVMSYQSLEDRIVKRALAAGATSRTPPGIPVELPEHRPYLRLLTHGAETASPEEIATNPRSASVRRRAAGVVRDREEAAGARCRCAHHDRAGTPACAGVPGCGWSARPRRLGPGCCSCCCAWASSAVRCSARSRSTPRWRRPRTCCVSARSSWRGSPRASSS